MKYKKVYIDSLNLSGRDMGSIFWYDENYLIEDIKTLSTFKPRRWLETFGKSLTKNIFRAKIVHTHLGLTLPLKTFGVTKKYQTLELAGLYGYNERSTLLRQTFTDLASRLQGSKIKRIDIALDYGGAIPSKIMKSITKTRRAFKYGNTTYYKTAKEKKTNAMMDIKIYNKTHKDNLGFSLMRLEFVFKGSYLNNMKLREIDKAFKKMEKTIKRIAGVSVKIQAINSL
jgi:hypothetical protein